MFRSQNSTKDVRNLYYARGRNGFWRLRYRTIQNQQTKDNLQLKTVNSYLYLLTKYKKLFT